MKTSPNTTAIDAKTKAKLLTFAKSQVDRDLQKNTLTFTANP